MVLALLYYIPDRWRKGSLSLPPGRQEGEGEGFRAYDDELISLRNSWEKASKNWVIIVPKMAGSLTVLGKTV